MAETNEARAEARFREASAAFDAGHVDAACVGFEQSLHFYPTLGTLLNVALCHEKQGRTATAWFEFTRAAGWANDPAQRDRREFAHQHAAHLERALARVQIDLSAMADEGGSVSIAIDREPMSAAQLALPLFLDAGDHTVVATAPARKAYEARFRVPAAGVGLAPSPLVVAVPALAADMPPALPPSTVDRAPPPSSKTRRIAGWAVGGVGVAAFAVGVGSGIDALGKADNLASCRAACDAAPAKTSEAVSIAAFSGGLAMFAAGAWLLFAPSPSPSPSAGRVALMPIAAPRVGGLAIYGFY